MKLISQDLPTIQFSDKEWTAEEAKWTQRPVWDCARTICDGSFRDDCGHARPNSPVQCPDPLLAHNPVQCMARSPVQPQLRTKQTTSAAAHPCGAANLTSKTLRQTLQRQSKDKSEKMSARLTEISQNLLLASLAHGQLTSRSCLAAAAAGMREEKEQDKAGIVRKPARCHWWQARQVLRGGRKRSGVQCRR